MLFLALILLVGAASAAIDLSGTSPDVAKAFATNNSLEGFTDWILPDYGHYATEFWQDTDELGRPTSLLNWSASVDLLPPSVG